MARLTWDEMVEKYPDQWIAVKDAEMDGADIESGEVVAYENDMEDFIDFRIKNRHTYKFCRTSVEDIPGIIMSTNFGIKIE